MSMTKFHREFNSSAGHRILRRISHEYGTGFPTPGPRYTAIRAFGTSLQRFAQPSRFQKPGSKPAAEPQVISDADAKDIQDIKRRAQETINASKVTIVPRPVATGRPVKAEPERKIPKIADINSKEYKQAERKWVSTMVALPILLVTSYYLFDRLALGKQPPPLPVTKTPSPSADPKV